MNWIVVIKIQHSMCIEWLSEIGTRFWTENSRLLVQCVTILSIQNCPLATPRFELGTPVRNVRREHGRFAGWRKWSSANSPSFPSLHVRHSSFSNPSVASPTSQLILQPLRCFTYVTAHFPTILSLLLRHSSFSNHSFDSPTSQPLHLRHLASRPWTREGFKWCSTQMLSYATRKSYFFVKVVDRLYICEILKAL